MTMTTRTQVGIIGAGPSGLLLAHLLAQNGIHSVIVERQNREYIEGRVRAGVLEQGSVDILTQAGMGTRLHAEGLVHDGFSMIVEGKHHRIDLHELTGKNVTVYGQTEVTKDLMQQHADAGTDIRFNVEDVEPTGLDHQRPMIQYKSDGTTKRIECDYIAGCDGYHGVSRRSIPENIIKTFERVYPFGWFGLLSQTPPVSDELIYASHKNGFALCSMRSTSRSRYYIQCSNDEIAENWSDDRFWDELSLRIGPEASKSLITGPSIEKSVAPLRSFVAEPMSYNRLYLVGDAAHIVPPTGAKGLNLAIADVHRLATAFTDHYASNDSSRLRSYSVDSLRRVWKIERFTWWMTMLLHKFPDHSRFDKRLQSAEFDYLINSTAGATMLAENYVGLPLD